MVDPGFFAPPRLNVSNLIGTPTPGVDYGLAQQVRETHEATDQLLSAYNSHQVGGMAAPYAIIGTGIGFIDTVGQSFGIIDNETNAAWLRGLGNTFGSGFRDYYSRNREPLRMAGDFVGMFIPGMMASKLIAGEGMAMRLLGGLGRTRAVRSIFTSGKTFEQILQPVRAYDLLAAGRASRSLSWGTDLTRRGLMATATRTLIGDSLKRTIAFEAGVALTMNESDFLYPDDMSAWEYLVYNAALPLAGVGLEVALARRAFRTSASAVAKAASDAANPSGTDFLNMFFMPMNDIGEGGRSIGITNLAHARNTLVDGVASHSAQGDTQHATNLLKEQNAVTHDLDAQLEKLFNDKTLGSSILTPRETMSPAQRATLISALDQNPNTLLGAFDLSRAPETSGRVNQLLEEHVNLVKKLDDEITELTTKQADTYDDARAAQINRIEQKIKFVREMQQFVLDTDGTVIPLQQYKPTYDDISDFSIKPSTETTTSPQMWIMTPRPDLIKSAGGPIAVTKDMQLIMPADALLQGGETELGKAWRTNMTKVERVNIDTLAKGGAPYEMNDVISSYIKAYHREGPQGKLIFAKLSDEAKSYVLGRKTPRDWDAAVAAKSPVVDELYQAYQPLRDTLRKFAHSYDDTIVLYRGEKPDVMRGKVKDHRTLRSYSTSPRVAGAFSRGRGPDPTNINIKEITSKRVSIDDIAYAGVGFDYEFEVMVRNSDIRQYDQAADAVNTAVKSGMPSSTIKVTPEQLRRLSPSMRSKAQLLYRHVINTYFRNNKFHEPQGIILAAGPDDPHYVLDAWIELLQKGGEPARKALKLPPALQGATASETIEKLEWISLRSKFEEFQLLNAMQNRLAVNRIIKTKDKFEVTDYDIQKILNLPGTPTGELHPAMLVFKELALQKGFKDLDHAVKGMEHFQRMMQETTVYPHLAQFDPKVKLPTRGNRYSVGTKRAPVRMVRQGLKEESWSAKGFKEAETFFANWQMQRMLNPPQDAGFVGTVIKLLHSISATQQAKQIDNVIQGAMAGTTLTQKIHAVRDNPTMLALEQAMASHDRQIRPLMEQVFAPHKALWTEMRSPARRADLTSFATYVQANRHGWYLKEAPVTQTEGGKTLFGFVLDHSSEYNKDKFRQLYGEALTPDTVMPAFGKDAYTPLYITEHAFRTAVSIDQLEVMRLNNLNFIRSLVGLKAINKRNWHIPARNLSRRHVRYLVNTAADRVERVVDGRTAGDVERKVQQLIGANPELADMKIMSQTDINFYSHLMDDVVFRNLVNYADVLAQTGVGSKGRTAIELTETGEQLLNGMIETIQYSFEGMVRRARGVYFSPQINFARRAERAISWNVKETGQKSIFQSYIDSIMGSQSGTPHSSLGKAYQYIETQYDETLNKLYDMKATVGQMRRRRNMRVAEHEFKGLQKELGQYNPFSNTADYMQRTFKLSAPPSMRQHMATGNGVITAVTLRMLDTAQTVMNFMGLAANMPSVIRGLNKLKHETEEQWITRIAAHGSSYGKDKIPVFHPVKSLANSFHWAFTKEGQAIWADAAKKGYMEQEAAELMRILSAPQQNYFENMVTKFTDKVSWLTDKSEKWTRGLAFMNFVKYGKDMLGFKNVDDLYTFAHWHANEVIGDYRSANRPQIFQGAVGMPLGLFQTFVWNYYQRLFGYIERRDWRALGYQYFAQQSLFGAQSVPGFDLFANYFFESADGTNNIVDGMNAKFGREFTDWMMYGTLSNISKTIFNDGVSLYTRGDVNIKAMPGIWNIEGTPMYNFGKQITQGIGSTIDMFRAQGFSLQRMTEIMAQHSVNRPLKGLLEIASGYSLDAVGQVISNDTRNTLSILARAIGTRPMAETKMREAWYRLRTTQFSQQARRATMRDNLRSAFRSGSISEDLLRNALDTYMRTGGDPNDFGRWLRHIAISSVVPKAELELQRILGSGGRRGYDYLRLMNTGAINAVDFE